MKNAHEIEALYESTLVGPFPYDECRYLISCVDQDAEQLIPALDWFFAMIAGYSHSASRFMQRSVISLDEARTKLSKSFLEYFPEMDVYIPYITSDRTPILQSLLSVSEDLRVALLALF